MKKLIETICQQLVDDPTNVTVKEIAGNSGSIFEMKVKKAEIGKIIGKQGVTINAVRVLMKNIAARNEKKVTIEVSEV